MRRFNRKKLLEAVGDDELLADFLQITGRAFLRLCAERRLRILRESTGAAMRNHQSQGRRMSAVPPYGWMADPQNPTRIIECPGEKVALELIARWFREGLSYREIASRLNTEAHAARTAKGWTRQAVGRAARSAARQDAEKKSAAALDGKENIG